MTTKLKKLLESIEEDNNGKMQGGFVVIKPSDYVALIGGDTANNCNGGNCYTGCGNNTVPGCSSGGGTNYKEHCGV
jgi:hypothetical protein